MMKQFMIKYLIQSLEFFHDKEDMMENIKSLTEKFNVDITDQTVSDQVVYTNKDQYCCHMYHVDFGSYYRNDDNVIVESIEQNYYLMNIQKMYITQHPLFKDDKGDMYYSITITMVDNDFGILACIGCVSANKEIILYYNEDINCITILYFNDNR